MKIDEEKCISVRLGDWSEIGTSGVERMSDDHLLRAMQDVRCFSGWGLVAELCKRFRARKNDG